MRTFLLGAGASHSYDRSPTGVRPPLARGVFDAYNQLAIAQDRFVLVGEIVNYVRDTRSIDPTEFGTWNEDIESFLTEVDDQIATPAAALSLGLTERARLDRVFTQCVFLFASVLNEIQNGPPCSHYTRLACALNEDDAVVTFNWDTLLDRVLWEQRRWSPADGYGVTFRLFYDDGWVRSSRASGTGIQLLKLHGSTNWLVPYFGLNPNTGERQFHNPAMQEEQRPLLCFIQSRDPYKTYENRTKTGYEPFSYYYYPPDMPGALGRGLPGRKLIRAVTAPDLEGFARPEEQPRGPLETMPYIVAPVRHKDVYLLDETIAEIWSAAETAIAASDELIIAGYSFPPTDTKAWDLLAAAVSGRNESIQLTVVNPQAEELAVRLREKLGGSLRVRTRSETFDSYVASLPPVVRTL